MLFNSVQYWIFLPIVWCLYFALPFRVRWIWLLGASYVFYGFWKWEFVGLMLLTSFIDWQCALRVSQNTTKKWQRFWLWFSIGSNLAMLFMFKYFDFAAGDSAMARYLLGNNYTAWIIELGKYTIPAGISFYTFQSISYVVDVYRKTEKAEKNLFRFMLYVSFFPQLVAGPIERFGRLHSQLFTKYSPRWDDISRGFRIILYGLFLKVCVADNLAAIVDNYYGAHGDFSTSAAWTAVFAFSFQVYTDFFGYSLLAQGSALLFGIHLMDNFNKPYLAKTIPEFWHRWHISLSTWFRDYVFIPVGGNKHGPWVLAVAVMLVFFTSGLWHGASMTMIVFGCFHGLMYLFDRFIFGRIKLQGPAWDWFRRIKTYFIFMISLVWFRAMDLGQASAVLRALAGKNAGTQNPEIPLHIPLFLLLFILLDEFIIQTRIDHWLEQFPKYSRWGFYLAAITCIWIWGGATNHPFVYFQF